MESYYRLQYEILGYIDEGKVNAAKEYLENRIQHKDTDALTILGLLYIYGVGLEKNEEKGRQMIQEAIQKGNTAANQFEKEIFEDD